VDFYIKNLKNFELNDIDIRIFIELKSISMKYSEN